MSQGGANTYGGDESFSSDIIVQSSVKGMSNIDGPYGSLQAVRIHHDLEIPGLQDAIDAARQSAEAQGIDIQRFEMTFEVDLDVFFAPSLHAIVLEAITFDITVDLAATQTVEYGPYAGESHSFEAYAKTSGQYAITLVGADLAEAPETPLSGNVASTIEPPALPDPQTQAETGPVGDDDSPGHLTAKASKAQINAAENPSVTFDADAGGAIGAVHWRLYDGAGVIVRQGEGTSFATTFDRPGLYQASFYTYDYATKATLTANVQLRADYKVEEEAVTCPLHSVGIGTVQSQCDARVVPLGAGMTSLKLTAERTPLISESGLGSLVVTQGGNEIARVMMANNVATVDIDQSVANDGDLQMQYVTPAGVSDSLTYSIAGIYDTVEAPAAGGARAMFEDNLELLHRFA